MPTGTIARLLIDKGFGFIRDEGGIEHVLEDRLSCYAIETCIAERQKMPVGEHVR